MSGSRTTQAEFDRIALFPEGGFDHNAYYHEFLSRFLPPRAGEALDLGCGTGQFTRVLAARADRVLGLDFSGNMIRVARERSAGMSNIEFLQADATSWDWPVERFDCIVSIATLHHLPMEDVLERMKGGLRPGGILLVLDLCRSGSAAAFLLLNAVAMPASLLLRLWHEGRLLRDSEVRRVWREHGKRDRYPTVDGVRAVCRKLLPGAKVYRHLLWRYSVVWRKP